MKIRLRPRFFLTVSITAVLIAALSFLFFKKSGELKDGSILAAETSSYDLIESSTGALLSEESSSNPDEGTHTEITISHTVKQGDTLYSIASKYHADPQTIIDYPYNNFGEDLTLKVGQALIIPNGYIDNPPPPPVIAQGTGQFIWPVSGVLTQYSSWWHPGAIDIAAKYGTQIKSADNGRVVKAEKFSTGYGWHVVIDHEDGLTSLYAHMSEITVGLGQTISKGHIIGLIGSTGRSTGPHLHFEVHKNGQPIDPMTFLPPR